MTTETMKRLFGKHKRLRYAQLGDRIGAYVIDERWTWQLVKAVKDTCYDDLRERRGY